MWLKFKKNCITERHPKKAHHSQHSLIFPSIQCRVINWFNNLQSPPPPTYLRENHFNKSLVWIRSSLKKVLGVDFWERKLLEYCYLILHQTWGITTLMRKVRLWSIMVTIVIIISFRDSRNNYFEFNVIATFCKTLIR